jgi:hypothetical protein
MSHQAIMTKPVWSCLVLLAALFGLLSCTGGEGGTPDSTAPYIVSVSPTDGEIDVNTTLGIRVTFNEAVDPASFDPTVSFTVETSGAVQLAGTIRVNGAIATFVPSEFLQPNTSYTVTITTGIRDLAGNSLTSGKQWHFETGALRSVRVGWDANREVAVNRSGGGYRLYFSTRSGFAIDDSDVDMTEVPYVSGALAPTSVLIPLHRTRYYFRVVAYSALTAPWGSGGSRSEPSAQVTVLVP